MLLIENSIFFSTHQTVAVARTLENNPESIKSYIEIFFPKGLKFINYPLTYYTDSVEGYYNFIVTQQNPVFLPNWLSELIQIFGNQHLTITNLKTFQEWVFSFLNKFRILCEIRAALWWWLMFNPYQEPFNTLRILTEWYLTAFTGIFPIIIGIDIGPSISIGLLGFILDYLNRLVFTMPYLPSEGEKFTLATLYKLDNTNLVNLIGHLGVEEVTVFRYLPSLWYKYTIPDNIRESWYDKKREVFDYFIKYYGNSGIDFLPNRILKATYEENPIFGNVKTFKDISTSFIVTINDTLTNNNIITNKLVKILSIYNDLSTI